MVADGAASRKLWQFRPYSPGEDMARIDWRRSARDDHHTYVRDKEWQAAHTVWLWADLSASMMYHSKFGQVSKESRALSSCWRWPKCWPAPANASAAP